MVKRIHERSINSYTGIHNMDIAKVSNNSSAGSIQDSADIVRRNLETLAKVHNVSVDELLQSAQSADNAGPAYLNRALILKARLDRLESRE